MSEALIFSSTDPQYDNRLFIELQVQYMIIPFDARISASEKDLPGLRLIKVLPFQ